MTDQAAPTAAVLIIGDEILSGRTQDVNLNAIARFLAALGIDETRRAETVTVAEWVALARTLSA